MGVASFSCLRGQCGGKGTGRAKQGKIGIYITGSPAGLSRVNGVRRSSAKI